MEPGCLRSVATLAAVASRLPPPVATCLVVGHNPGMDEWVGTLCGAQVRLPTAAIAAIELPLSQWAELTGTRGQLHWLVTPALVKCVG